MTTTAYGDQAFTWPADLSLEFTAHPRYGCRLIHCRHRGPLRVQKPFYPEGRQCAHVYLLHPPGGMVSGDTLNIEINLAENAHALLTTPGAGKVYAARKNGTRQVQTVHLNAGCKAAIEWFPQEAIIFQGAEAMLANQLHLADDAVFIGWDIVCLGHPASAIRFDKGSFEQSWQIWRGDKLRFTERLIIDRHNSLGDAICGLNRQPVVGTFFATLDGHKNNRDLKDELRYRCAQLNSPASNRSALDTRGDIAITMVHDLCIARYLGASTGEAKQFFQALWQVLRPLLLNREVCAPGIWRT